MLILPKRIKANEPIYSMNLMRNTNAIVFCFLFFGVAAAGQEKIKTATEFPKMEETPVVDTVAVPMDSIKFSKSSEMLDEEVYWAIVANSLKESNNQEDQELFLVAEIEKLTPKEMVGFRLRTDKLLFDTYNPELWCAAYIMNGGVSDGDFDYFRCWLISRGKDVFYKTKSDPDYLINQVVPDQKSYQFESFWYVAVSAFKNKTGKELYSYVDYDQFITNDENYPLLNFTWNVDEPQSMGKICPMLFKNLWK